MSIRKRCAAVCLLWGTFACSNPNDASSSAGGAGGGTDTAQGGTAQGGMVQGEMAQGGAVGSAGSAATSESGGTAGAGSAPGSCVLPKGNAPAGSEPEKAAAAAVPSTATRPQLERDVVETTYTIAKFLERTGTVAATFTSSGASVTTADAPVVDNWDPVTNGIGDVSTFRAQFTVASDGSGTHRTVQEAISAAALVSGCDRVYVRVLSGTYREGISVPKAAPPITLYSTESDAAKTVIVFGNAAGMTPAGATGRLGTSGSATFSQNAVGFRLKNITIVNDFVEGTLAGSNEQAVAFLNQGDKLQCENVRFLGNQDTLYLKTVNAGAIARAYFRDSYIEGDTDFIFGRGTSVFDHCEIKTVGTSKTSGTCAAAPSTELTNAHGFLFISSRFTADANVTGAFLARQWFEGSRETAVGKMIVRNSTIGAHIPAAAPWKAWGSRTSPKNPASTATLILYTSDDYYATDAPVPAEPYLAEYGND